jgi:hypothetical protein
VLFAAVASHYIQDAHMPLHASNNNDGQLTGQTGLHARFETTLFERYQSKLTINPAPIASIANPRDAAFDTLLASHQLVERLLQADREAAVGRDSYDDVLRAVLCEGAADPRATDRGLHFRHLRADSGRVGSGRATCPPRFGHAAGAKSAMSIDDRRFEDLTI